jgi:anaerobic magnesium-protoporphyrin IX monomethyl ester cyclase
LKPDESCHALLLQPPPGDLTGPYPALCYLKSFAAEHGYRVNVKDLGIEALHYLSHPERVAGMLQGIHRQCHRLEVLPTLGVGEQQHYGRLLAALPAHDQPEWFSKCFQLFRRPDLFFDYQRYKQARTGLIAFFDLLSALHYPTILSAAEYPTATMLKTMDNVLAHQDPAVNPYVRYYEEVLFPLIAGHRPCLVGISMVFANQSVQALVLGRMIKARFPHVYVVLGGAYLSQWAMTADDAQVAQLLTCADAIICGEGEQAFSDLLARVIRNDTPAELPNLIYRDAATQNLIRFDRLNYTDIADQPPPDFSDLDLDSYLSPQTVIPYCISRGCYWGRCVFCQNRYGDHSVRRYQTVSVDKAVAEMAGLADRYGSDHFNFSNDVIDPAYLKKLSQAMLDSGRTFSWNTDLRAEKAYDAPTCRLMARAGLKSVAIGFESGCQKTLDAMDKGKQVEIISQVLDNFYTAGVATQAMGIFGMPGESEADGEETVRFLEANAQNISYYVMGLLMVLPGSRMHNDPLAHGVSAISYGHTPLRTPEPIWQSATRMSVDSVNRLYERLSQLEQLYAIDEYPFVGGLCTNHGFLYYTLGPDILKRLRKDEQAELGRLQHLLGFDGSPVRVKNFAKLVPRQIFPHHKYRSCFALHRLCLETGEAHGAPALVPANDADYLLLPGYGRQMPVMVGGQEVKILNRINGRRTLRDVLKKVEKTEMKRALSFVWLLVQNQMIEFQNYT